MIRAMLNFGIQFNTVEILGIIIISVLAIGLYKWVRRYFNGGK